MTNGTTLEDVLETIADYDRPIFTASELAEELPIQRRMTLYKLEDLETRGDVVSQQAGANARVWYPASLLEWWADRADDVGAIAEYVATHEGTADPTEEFDPDFDVDEALQEAAETDASAVDVDLDRFHDEWDGDYVEERLDAAEVALERLQEAADGNGGTYRSAGDVREWADELAPPSQQPDTFWRKTVRPAFKLAAEEGKTEYTRNKGWRWTGGETS